MAGSKYEVMSELYRILGKFEARDFLGAKNTPGLSERMRRVLDLLALELGSRPVSRAKDTMEVVDANLALRLPKGNVPRLADPIGKQFEIYLYERLRNKKDFPTKSELQKLARMFGVQTRIDTKDSTKRLVGKLVTAFLAAPASVKSEVLDFLSKGQDEQTRGWIDVIRRST
jgi:hypothetical protein